MPRVTAFLALLVSLVLAVAAAAQPTPPTTPPGWVPTRDLPTVASGRLGAAPANAPANTPSVKLYDAQTARELNDIVARLTAARARCNFADFLAAMNDFSALRDRAETIADALQPGALQDTIVRGRANADLVTMRNFWNSLKGDFPQWYFECPLQISPRQAAPDDATLPTIESGQLGLPENPIPGTSLPMFDPWFAGEVGKALENLRTAVDRCEPGSFRDAVVYLFNVQRARASQGEDKPGRDRVSRAKADHDTRSFAEWLRANWIRYPIPCEKRVGMLDRLDRSSDTPRFAAFVTGGGQFALGGRSGAITGVDSFFGPGALLIDNRLDGGVSQTTGLLGIRLRAYATLVEGAPTEQGGPPAPPLAGLRGFFESGVQSGFGGTSFTQGFSGVNTVPQGFGQQTVTESFQIPIVIGVSLPVTNGTRFDFYGGVVLDSWTHMLAGGETGAPGSTFSAAQNRFTVDPTVGVGLQVALARNIVAGINAELQFRPGSVVTAPSAAFNSQVYYGTINPVVNLQATARIGFVF